MSQARPGTPTENWVSCVRRRRLRHAWSTIAAAYHNREMTQGHGSALRLSHRERRRRRRAGWPAGQQRAVIRHPPREIPTGSMPQCSRTLLGYMARARVRVGAASKGQPGTRCLIRALVNKRRSDDSPGTGSPLRCFAPRADTRACEFSVIDLRTICVRM